MGLLQDHRGPTRAQIGKQEHMLAKTNKKGNQRNIRSVITEQLYRKENQVGNIGLGRIINCHLRSVGTVYRYNKAHRDFSPISKIVKLNAYEYKEPHRVNLQPNLNSC